MHFHFLFQCICLYVLFRCPCTESWGDCQVVPDAKLCEIAAIAKVFAFAKSEPSGPCKVSCFVGHPCRCLVLALTPVCSIIQFRCIDPSLVIVAFATFSSGNSLTMFTTTSSCSSAATLFCLANATVHGVSAIDLNTKKHEVSHEMLIQTKPEVSQGSLKPPHEASHGVGGCAFM